MAISLYPPIRQVIRCRFYNNVYHLSGCENITVIIYNVNRERIAMKERII
ncbi:MAG: hypothetical protein JRC66_07815 [Deltaproteobacteria bacterium]|nr:hypothetical protein [Deltaproteobacteria bacterium]